MSIKKAQSKLAHKYLRLYRFWRSQGQPIRLARSLALFSIVAGKGGASNLLAQNHFHKCRKFWQAGF